MTSSDAARSPQPDPRASELEALLRANTRTIASLERQLAAVIAASADSNADDEHDPEGATIAYERQQAASLLHQARRTAEALQAALRRVEEGTYGTCESCGRAIAAGRLAARPDASRCIDCAR